MKCDCCHIDINDFKYFTITIQVNGLPLPDILLCYACRVRFEHKIDEVRNFIRERESSK